MLRRAKMATVFLATTVAAIVVYQLAAADTPQTDELIQPSPQVVFPAPQVVFPAPAIPGWVRQDMQIRVPMWVPEGFPAGPAWGIPKHLPMLPPPWPLPPMGPVAAPVDEGSLKMQERVVPDGFGGQYLLRERTWTSQGVPHREITEIYPVQGMPIPETAENLPGLSEQPEVAPQPVPDPAAEQPLVEQPAVEQPLIEQPPIGQPVAPEAPDALEEGPAPQAEAPLGLEEQPVPADKMVLVPVPDEQVQAEGVVAEVPPPAVVEPGRTVGVGVSVDSRNGTRVWEYYQGAPAQAYEKSIDRRVYIHSAPGLGRGVGAGISVDPQHGTRVYRYYHGDAPQGSALTPVQPPATSPQPPQAAPEHSN